MIKSLQIKNYALIQTLEMTPSPNLNIITGETGAGKSIMLGAVGLLLGNRADTKALFSDEEKCVVEGVFDLSDYQLKPLFQELDLEYDPECIIRREISPNGKSRGFINDLPVTLDVMKALGERLMDIHSQHESLQLGENSYQRSILDSYGQNLEFLAAYQSSFNEYKKAEKIYNDLIFKSSEGKKESDYQNFLFEELQSANLSSGEEETLEAEQEILENAELIKINLSQITQLLDESEFSVVPQLKSALPLLTGIKKYSTTYQELFDRLSSAAIELQDLHNEITREQEAVEVDPQRLQLVKERLDLLFRLQQKHQVKSSIELIELRNRLDALLSETANLDGLILKAKAQKEKHEKDLHSAGLKLTTRRKNIAPQFSKAIESIIHKLGIENGKVEIQVLPTSPQPHGMDQIEMLFSANKGVNPKELKFVASGGEFSRLIFAVKYLLADKTALPTIIFDEIDTGVSGEIALQMVAMMKKMAQNHQVISISHLPQFAAGGEAHYFVYKDHSSDKSVSRIKLLEAEERVTAIARMIGGDQPGSSAFESARELLKR